MKEYIYKVKVIRLDEVRTGWDIEKQLGDMGEHGEKLVSVNQYENILIYTFQSEYDKV